MQQKTASMDLRLKVNGREHRLSVNPRDTLLTVLREELGLTGTKQGCEDGTCGTCVVTVNGAVARACRVHADGVAGKEVLTIEGLGTPEHLHPLQEAFVATGAVQCGFCTPGAVMAAKALLDRNPDPTRTEIARAFGRNLCRCTGYVSMLDAVTRVAHSARSTETPPSAADTAAELHHRPDARDKVLGRALYAADLTMPGMLHAAVLRSPHPHADIVDIDDREARALPGVVAVVTGKDVPGLNRYGRVVKDQRVLADGRGK